MLASADDASGWDAELEKRSALGALVLATRTFPVDVVLPASDQLVPSARDVRAAVRRPGFPRRIEVLPGCRSLHATYANGLAASF